MSTATIKSKEVAGAVSRHSATGAEFAGGRARGRHVGVALLCPRRHQSGRRRTVGAANLYIHMGCNIGAGGLPRLHGGQHRLSHHAQPEPGSALTGCDRGGRDLAVWARSSRACSGASRREYLLDLGSAADHPTITVLVYLAYLFFRNGIDNRQTRAAWQYLCDPCISERAADLYSARPSAPSIPSSMATRTPTRRRFQRRRKR